jgi:hypothetical protein
MAECFCGCGRKVKFTDRGLNSQGRYTVELVGKLTSARERLEKGPLVEGGDNTPVIERMLTPAIDQGDEFAELFQAAVHHEPLPGPRQANQLRGEWRAWRKSNEPLANIFSLPLDEMTAAIKAI